LDLVTAGGGTSKGEATVFLGAGDGTFSPVHTLATEPNESAAVTLGDLNGDGVLDMVTAGNKGFSGEATVFLGAGDATFSKVQTLATESANSSAVTLGDLNGDGVLDLVTAGQTDGAGEATVFLGAGDGTFSEVQTLDTEFIWSEAVTLADLNGDRVLDIVTAGVGISEGEATVFLGAGDGTFSEAQSLATEGTVSHAVELGDLNGDGVLDIVTAGYYGIGGPGEATVFIGAGDGTFSEAQTLFTESSKSNAVELGDLNGDSVLDIVTAGGYNPGEATVFLGGTTSGVSPLLDFSLTTEADARQALPVFQRKLDQLSAQRGQIGAFQARVEVAINKMQVEKENYTAARSQITDADVAWESAQLVRNNILQQAGAAVLAQANQAPALALSLLGGG
jgi:flagellin-like hook-associated protein FlgL